LATEFYEDFRQKCDLSSATEETEEEKMKRLEVEQEKLDRQNGRLEYFAAIIEEGL